MGRLQKQCLRNCIGMAKQGSWKRRRYVFGHKGAFRCQWLVKRHKESIMFSLIDMDRVQYQIRTASSPSTLQKLKRGYRMPSIR